MRSNDIKHIKYLHIAVFGLIFINSVIIIWNSFGMGQPGHASFETQILLQHKELSDSIVNIEKLSASDSINIKNVIDSIQWNQKLIIAQQNDLINDVRQETNNNIDKLNLWITYAICLISVIGVFIPVILQIKFRSDDKEKIREIEQKNDKLREDLRKDVDEQMMHYNKSFKKLNEETQNALLLIKNAKKLQEYRAAFLSLCFGYDDRTLSVIQIERQQLLMYLWDNAVKSFEELVKLCFSSSVTEDEKKCFLIESNLLMYSFASKMKCESKTRRNRKWDVLTDDIKYILKELNHQCHCDASWAIIKNNIENLIISLHNNKISEL